MVEFAEMGIGLPRGHPPREKDFAHHGGPTFDLLVIAHREGTEATLGVAAHTFLAEEGSDGVGVGDGFSGVGIG